MDDGYSGVPSGLAEALAAVRRELAKLDAAPVSRSDVILAARPEIMAAREAGHGWRAINEALGRAGIHVSDDVLRQLVMGPKRPRRTLPADGDGGGRPLPASQVDRGPGQSIAPRTTGLKPPKELT